jgi:FkbM family methyltransferase
MSDKKFLNVHMDTSNLCMASVSQMYDEFFVRKDYDWWYKVQPDDVVVDIGACVGMFTAHALDLGAKCVYAVEPNKDLMKCVIENTQEAVTSWPQRVIPVEYAIGSDPSHTNFVFYTDDFKTMSFQQFINRYDIYHIDYLKLDCEGGEYDVLSEENLEWVRNNVKHISVECHLRASPDGPEKFIEFRDKFLRPYLAEQRVKFQQPHMIKAIYNDEAILNKRYGEFIMYITG